MRKGSGITVLGSMNVHTFLPRTSGIQLVPKHACEGERGPAWGATCKVGGLVFQAEGKSLLTALEKLGQSVRAFYEKGGQAPPVESMGDVPYKGE